MVIQYILREYHPVVLTIHCGKYCVLLLRLGDQILEVDSVSLHHAALSEAYSILSECGPGLVRLIISRHRNNKVGG